MLIKYTSCPFLVTMFPMQRGCSLFNEKCKYRIITGLAATKSTSGIWNMLLTSSEPNSSSKCQNRKGSLFDHDMNSRKVIYNFRKYPLYHHGLHLNLKSSTKYTKTSHFFRVFLLPMFTTLGYSLMVTCTL